MNYFYTDSDGNQCGPISASALKDLAMFGEITPSTLITTEDGSKTVAAQKVKGLVFLCSDSPQAAPVPISPPPPPIENDADNLDGVDLHIADGQIKIHGVWYTTSNITSVSVEKKVSDAYFHQKSVIETIGCYSALFFLVSFVCTVIYMCYGELSIQALLAAILFAGGVVGTIVFYVKFRPKAEDYIYYAIMLSTNAGEKEAIKTKKHGRAMLIVDKINAAIRTRA